VRRRSHPRRSALLSASAIALTSTAVALWFWILALSPVSQDTSPVLFSVPPGATLLSVASDLEQVHLVRSRFTVECLGRLRGLADHLRAGEYELSAAFDTWKILSRLRKGRIKLYEVLLPEGITASEIAARLATAGLANRDEVLTLVLATDAAKAFGIEGPTLEGYLFPDTYRLARGIPPREILQTFVAQFLRVWSELAPQAEKQKLSQREVVTLASIIEKETAAPQERSLIASVFRNRLSIGMRLESDPTVIYGIQNFDGNLRRKHLEDEANRYNTYRIRGLPPGAIANPGRAALRAALEPAETDYLYFVSRNNGVHIFSKSYAEHTQAVRRYQRRGAP